MIWFSIAFAASCEHFRHNPTYFHIIVTNYYIENNAKCHQINTICITLFHLQNVLSRTALFYNSNDLYLSWHILFFIIGSNHL